MNISARNKIFGKITKLTSGVVNTEVVIALPGGVGTLEELVEQLTWAQLQRHRKPVLLADVDGFWRPLLALFAHMRNLGFIREQFEVRYIVAEKIEDALPMLRAAARRLAAPAA